MTRATIVGGAPLAGSDSYYEALFSEADVLIAADAGASVCHRLGRVPDYLVGDLDSISVDTLRWTAEAGVVTRTAPVHKDVTDLDLALECARDAGSSAVTITAAWTSRLDHTLAAIATAAGVDDLVVDLADPGLAGWMLRPHIRTSVRLGPAGALCSLFAHGGPATLSTSGMRYELDRGTIFPHSSLGLSNVIDSDEALITLHDGVVLVLSHPLEDGICARLLGGTR